MAKRVCSQIIFTFKKISVMEAKQIQILIKCNKALKERLEKSADRNNRSLNKQVQHLLQEALLFDERFHALSAEQQLTVLKIMRDTVDKLTQDK